MKKNKTQAQSSQQFSFSFGPKAEGVFQEILSEMNDDMIKKGMTPHGRTNVMRAMLVRGLKEFAKIWDVPCDVDTTYD